MSTILFRKKRWIELHQLMVFPAFILFMVFFVVPIFQGLVLAFTDWDGFNAMHFIGLDNFFRFFTDDRSLNVVKNTIIYGISCTVLLNLFGILYALLLDSRIKLRELARTIVYLPVIISPLIMGYIFQLILSSENGVLLNTMKLLKVEGLYQDWLGDPNAAIWVIILVYIWQFVGGNMMIYLAGLQSIPTELHEASIVDGASYLQELWYVRLPLLAPSIRINVITNIIGTMSIFDVVMALTGGGPGYYTESLSIFIYRQSTANEAGYSAAVAIIMFLIILIPVALAFKAMDKMDAAV